VIFSVVQLYRLQSLMPTDLRVVCVLFVQQTFHYFVWLWFF